MLSDCPHASLLDIYVLIAKRIVCIDWSVSLRDFNAAKISLPGETYRPLVHGDLFTSGEHVDLLEQLAMGHRPTDQRRLANARFSCRRRRNDSRLDFVGGLYERDPFRSRATDAGIHEGDISQSSAGVADPASKTGTAADQRGER
jgi:hypothetical protein